MEFKPDVSLKGLSPQLLLALLECEKIYKGRLLTMTLEYVDTTCINLRTRGTGSTMSLLGDIKRKLLPAGYEVLVIDEGLDSEHLKVVYF